MKHTLAVAVLLLGTRAWGLPPLKPPTCRTLNATWFSVRAVAISPDGRTVAAGCLDGTVKVWDFASGRERASWRAQAGAVHALDYSGDGALLASGGSYGTVRLWKADTGQAAASLEGLSGSAVNVSLNGDGRMMAAASHDGTVVVWDVVARAERTRRRADLLPMTVGGLVIPRLGLAPALVLHADNDVAATVSGEGAVTVWPLSGRRQVPLSFALTPGALHLAFSRDGKMLVAASEPTQFKSLVEHATGERRLVVWELASRAERVVLREREAGYGCLAFSPEGRWLAAGAGSDSRNVTVWDLRSGRDWTFPTGHAEKVHAVAIGSNGRMLVTGSDDGTVKFWNLSKLLPK